MILLNNICLFLNKLYKYIYYNCCIYKDIEENFVDEKIKKNDDYENNYQSDFEKDHEHYVNDEIEHNYEFDYEIIDNMNNNKIVR